jgi:hypothetical protein
MNPGTYVRSETTKKIVLKRRKLNLALLEILHREWEKHNEGKIALINAKLLI